MSDIIKNDMKKIKLKGQKLDMVVDLVDETDEYYEVKHDLGTLRIDKSKVDAAEEEKIIEPGSIALIANGSGQRIPYIKTQAGYWLVAASPTSSDPSRNIGTRSVVDSFAGDNSEQITYKQFLDIVREKPKEKNERTIRTEGNRTATFPTMGISGDGPGSSNKAT